MMFPWETLGTWYIVGKLSSRRVECKLNGENRLRFGEVIHDFVILAEKTTMSENFSNFKHTSLLIGTCYDKTENRFGFSVRNCIGYTKLDIHWKIFSPSKIQILNILAAILETKKDMRNLTSDLESTPSILIERSKTYWKNVFVNALFWTLEAIEEFLAIT